MSYAETVITKLDTVNGTCIEAGLDLTYTASSRVNPNYLILIEGEGDDGIIYEVFEGGTFHSALNEAFIWLHENGYFNE